MEDDYSGVVSLLSIRILFLIATLNDLEIWAADIGNAFLHGITREKVYIIAGLNLGLKEKERN